MKFLKNVLLFFLAPFIALGYVVILPFVGLYMFISLSVEKSLKVATESIKEVITKSIRLG